MDTIIKKDGEPMPTLAFALDIDEKKAEFLCARR